MHKYILLTLGFALPLQSFAATKAAKSSPRWIEVVPQYGNIEEAIRQVVVDHLTPEERRNIRNDDKKEAADFVGFTAIDENVDQRAFVTIDQNGFHVRPLTPPADDLERSSYDPDFATLVRMEVWSAYDSSPLPSSSRGGCDLNTGASVVKSFDVYVKTTGDQSYVSTPISTTNYKRNCEPYTEYRASDR